MKLQSVNDVNVCELAFVPETAAISTCFNLDCSWYLLQTLSFTDNVEVVCCINFMNIIIKSYAKRSCVICIQCFI